MSKIHKDLEGPTCDNCYYGRGVHCLYDVVEEPQPEENTCDYWTDPNGTNVREKPVRGKELLDMQKKRG
jgi:hypothetical protein